MDKYNSDENIKKLALAAANIMIKNRSMFQKFNPLNSIHKILTPDLIDKMNEIIEDNKSVIQKAEQSETKEDTEEVPSIENSPSEQSTDVTDATKSPEENTPLQPSTDTKPDEEKTTNKEKTKEVSQMSDEEKLDAAKDSNTTPEVLEKLAYEDDVKIKAAIAANPSAPVAVLRNFKERSLLPEILASLATNPNLPQDIITDFINKGTDKTKASLASNESLTEEKFKSLYNSTNHDETEMALAENPKTPIEILQKLANNGINAKIKHQASTALKTRGSSNNLQESRQLFKGQSLEEKLKPIIEKMLRQYYR